MGELTLTETLSRLGYTHRAKDNGRHEIFSGEEGVFVGRAYEVWAWLRGNGEIR
jgi:hypothetical protein